MKRFDKAITTQRIEETPLHQIDLTGERNVTPIELRFPGKFPFDKPVTPADSLVGTWARVLAAKSREPDRILSARVPFLRQPLSYLKTFTYEGGWNVNSLAPSITWDGNRNPPDPELTRIEFTLAGTVPGRLSLVEIGLSPGGPGTFEIHIGGKATAFKVADGQSRTVDLVFREEGMQFGGDPTPMDSIYLKVGMLRFLVFRELRYWVL